MADYAESIAGCLHVPSVSGDAGGAPCRHQQGARNYRIRPDLDRIRYTEGLARFVGSACSDCAFNVLRAVGGVCTVRACSLLMF